MFGDRIASDTLRALHRLAARVARTRDEADDLVQDALLATLELELERDWDEGRFLLWMSGVIRRRAMFLARTAGRRRRRETTYALEASPSPAAEARLPTELIDALPPALQTVALLANAGLGREEIVHLIGISDAALRKRISDLRRAVKEAGVDAELSLPTSRHRPPCGALRRSLKSALRELPDAGFALADPDGHQIFLGPAHKRLGVGNS